MNWMTALLWFMTGVILTAMFFIYVERFIFKHGRVTSLGVCETPGCDKLHVAIGISLEKALGKSEVVANVEHGNLIKTIGYVERSPYTVPVAIRISEGIRKSLLEDFIQKREMKELAARAEPYDVLFVSNLASWNVMREQDDVTLQKTLVFIDKFEVSFSPLAETEKNEKEDTLTAADCAYFRVMIRDILGEREKNGILVQRGKVSEKNPSQHRSTRVL